MATYDAIIQELQKAQADLLTVWQPLRMRQARVTAHPPGGTSVDITDDYEAGFRRASDALNKAIAALRQVG
jgi:hypothetical protein